MKITCAHLLEAMKLGKTFDGFLFKNHHPNGIAKDLSKPWLVDFQPPIRRSRSYDNEASKVFEGAAKAAEEYVRKPKVPGSTCWPDLRRSDLHKALAIAAKELTNPPSLGLSPIQLLNMRRGLQLLNARIVRDDKKDEAPLDLSNGLLPFSLRLNLCIIEIPLSLSNLNLVTLDLSGSTLVGVEASFLRARGSVRLRRCYSSAPLDFTGSEIHGHFDASDALLHPFGILPASQSVSGDRGMLNLSQANIDNDVSLRRTIIMGGLSVRGLKTQRSVFLEEAVLLSPLAVLALLFEANDYPDISHLKERLSTPVAQLSFTKPLSIRLKIAANGIGESNVCLHILMTEDMRVRTSAVRGDGLTIGGSFFARGLKCYGRLRMKYANVSGSLALQSASLISVESQLNTFESKGDEIHEAQLGTIEKSISEYRKMTYTNLLNKNNEDRSSASNNNNVDDLATGADDYALDLRESHFGGNVRLGFLIDEPGSAGPVPTKVNGVLALDRARIDGDLVLNGVKFQWHCRMIKADRWKCENSTQSCEQDNPCNSPARCALVDYTARDCNRTARLNLEVRQGKRYAILATGLVTCGDFSLLNSTELNGLNLSNAKIGGDFALFDKMQQLKVPARLADATVGAPTTNSDQHHPITALEVKHTATGVVGRMELAGAQIAGDCKLLFSTKPNTGPDIRAERIIVSGCLTIAPGVATSLTAEAQQQTFDMSPEAYDQLLIAARKKRVALRAFAAEGLQGRTNAKVNFQRAYRIDLGNAKATFFHHPPPAWPETGQLIITGFHYQRARDSGPLAPLPFQTGGLKYHRHRLMWSLTVTISVALLLGATTLVALLYGGKIWIFDFGVIQTRLLVFFFLIAFIYRFFARHTNPNRIETRPMAIDWLNLQTVDKNAYRSNKKPFSKVGHTYHSLEAYSTASKALREAGRWISANLVEERRLIMRDEQLSWRGHFFQKFLYLMMNLVNNYGFNLSRPIFLLGLLVCSGALLAHHAGRVGAIEAKTYQVKVSERVVRPVQVDPVPPDSVCVTSLKPLPRGFVPIIFAVDQVVPILGFSQATDWEVTKAAAPLCGAPWLTFSILFSVIRMLGLGILGLFVLAFSTRIGLVFQRYND
jgi:hypothetical protein